MEITASKDVDYGRESSVAKTVVTREELVRYGDNTVAEVLRRIPGVTISGAPGRGGEIRLGGLGGNYTQILINGTPAPSGFSIESLSPSLIERIEVSRVATAEVSTQAIAGTINIILKQVARRAQREIKASTGGYQGNPSAFLDAQMSDRNDRFSYTLGGTLGRETKSLPATIEQRGFDAGGIPDSIRVNTKREQVQDDTLSVAPRLNWNGNGGDTLSIESLASVRATQDQVLDARTTLLGAPPLYAGNDLRLKADTTIFRATVGWARRFANEAKLDVKLGATNNARDSSVKFVGFDTAGSHVLDENTDSHAVDKSWSLNGKFRVPYVESHAISFGWDSELGQRAENRTQRQVAPAGYPALDLDEIYDARVTRVALYGQDEWEITPRWSAYLGLRWEGLRTRSLGNVMAEVQNRSSVLSPVLQSVWKVPNTKADQVRLGLSRTYKAPTTRNLMPRRYVANDNTATTPDLQGNPDLRPELAWGLNLAYEHSLGNAGSIGATAQARRVQDVILQQLSRVNGSWISSPVNNGAANVRGIELESRLSLRKLNTSLPQIEVRANVARNWSSVSAVPGPDNRLNAQTPVSANLGFDYQPDAVPLTLGGNFGFQGGAPVRLSETQTAASTSKRIVDLYALWKLDPRKRLRATLSNLLHEDYIAQASYFDASTRLDQVTTTPTHAVLMVRLEITL